MFLFPSFILQYEFPVVYLFLFQAFSLQHFVLAFSAFKAHSSPSVETPSYFFMADDHAPSQGTIDSIVSGTIENSNSNNTTLNNRVSACEKLVEDAIEKNLSVSVLAESLKDLGLKAGEAVDYIDEFNQRVAMQRSKPGNPTLHFANLQDHQIPHIFKRIEIELLKKLLGRRSVHDLRHQLQPSLLTSPPISSIKFSTSLLKRALLPLSFLNQSLLLLLTLPMTQTHCSKILTSMTHTSAKLPMLIKNPSKISSLKLKVEKCKSLSPTLSGNWSSSTSMSISKNYTLLWIQTTALTMKQKKSPINSLCWRSIPLVPDVQYPLKLNGCVCMIFGSAPYFTSTLIAELNSLYIVILLSICFEQLPHLSQLSSMTEILENATHDNPIVWIAAKTCFLFPFYPSSYLLRRLLLHLQGAKGNLQALRKASVSVLKRYVRIGISAAVMVIHVVMVASTTNAVSVMTITELKTKESVSLPSTSDVSNREHLQLAAAGHKAQEARATGTRQLKRKLVDSVSEIPRYKRGFVWEKSTVSSILSPSALATEFAPPLAVPPSQLLDDLNIQSMLFAMRDYIRIETPFNIDRFEMMLYDHPNQPFVKSVMNGLRYGFWPFDEGNWKDEHEEIIHNYCSKEEDFNAI